MNLLVQGGVDAFNGVGFVGGGVMVCVALKLVLFDKPCAYRVVDTVASASGTT